MSATNNSLSVWCGERAACIRVTGRANVTIVVEFKRLLAHFQEAPRLRLALDLSACRGMDSTFLGVLAHAATQRMINTGGRESPGLELWNPAESVVELITDLGVAHLFKITTPEDLEREFKAPPGGPGASREEVTRTCLEAHELLMALNPENVAKFKDAARYFAEELGRAVRQS